MGSGDGFGRHTRHTRIFDLIDLPGICQKCGIYMTSDTNELPCPPWSSDVSEKRTDSISIPIYPKKKCLFDQELNYIKTAVLCIRDYVVYGQINTARNAIDLLEEIIKKHEHEDG